MRARAAGGLLFVSALVCCPLAGAEPVTVRYTEGLTRGFPVLRSMTGDKLAQGHLTQVAIGDRVESRLVFHFADGSLHDETVVFSQTSVFTLLRYRLVQRGPSFPETVEAAVDRATEQYDVRYRVDDDSPEERISGRLTLPGDAYNGLLTTVLKNLMPGRSATVHIVAFTPRPRLVRMLLTPGAGDAVRVGDVVVSATRYHMKPQLGLFTSLLVADIPDVRCWIADGEAPSFLRFEGPLYFMGPVWRIEVN
jgi:hypothetical protein